MRSDLLHKLFLIPIRVEIAVYFLSLCLVFTLRKQRNERVLNVVASSGKLRRQNLRCLLRILKLHVQQAETQVCELDKVDEDFFFATPEKHAVPLVERQRIVLE